MAAVNDDLKNNPAWIWQLYNTFGKSLFAAAAENNEASKNALNGNAIEKQPLFDNILYSQLTKSNASTTPSPSDTMTNNNNNNHNDQKSTSAVKPEDLSQHKSSSSGFVNNVNDRSTPTTLIKVKTESNDGSPENNRTTESSSPLDVADCKVGIVNMKNMLINGADKVCSSLLSTSSTSNVREILDDLLYKTTAEANNNNNDSKNNGNEDNDESNVVNENDVNDEPTQVVNGPFQAIEHGEQFLKWLETCSDPSITAMQVMQFKALLNCIKTSAVRAASQVQNQLLSENGLATASNDQEQRTRMRKRKQEKPKQTLQFATITTTSSIMNNNSNDIDFGWYSYEDYDNFYSSYYDCKLDLATIVVDF